MIYLREKTIKYSIKITLHERNIRMYINYFYMGVFIQDIINIEKTF